MNLKFWKTYNIMVQLSLLIKLFLLVFIAAVIKLIQTETELWSKSLCIILQPAEMLLVENEQSFPTSWF